MKTKDVLAAYAVVRGAKLGGMETQDKLAVIRAAGAMRPVAEAFERFVEDARSRSAQNAEGAVAGELEVMVRAELESEATVSLPKIGEGALAKLCEANPELTVDALLAVQAVMVEP